MVSTSHVKISDFGLARKQVGNADYYKLTKDIDLPVYWYSPESLETFKFTTKGDVWSFGVTLWEMFTMGAKPFTYLPQFPRSQNLFKAVILGSLFVLCDHRHMHASFN